MHTYRWRYIDEENYVIEEVRTDGMIRQVSNTQINYLNWIKEGHQPEIIPYEPAEELQSPLSVLKEQKKDFIRENYASALRQGYECMPTDHPGVKFALTDTSLQRFKSIIDYSEIKGLTVVPFLYAIDGTKLENVPLNIAKQGLVRCFEEAMRLYVEHQNLQQAIEDCESEEELGEITWQG